MVKITYHYLRTALHGEASQIPCLRRSTGKSWHDMGKAYPGITAHHFSCNLQPLGPTRRGFPLSGIKISNKSLKSVEDMFYLTDNPVVAVDDTISERRQTMSDINFSTSRTTLTPFPPLLLLALMPRPSSIPAASVAAPSISVASASIRSAKTASPAVARATS